RPGRAPIEGSGVVGVQLGTGSDVSEPFPAAPEADDLHAHLGGPVGHALDDRVESRHVAAAGEHADSLRVRHPVRDGSAGAYDPGREGAALNYELYMGEALAEA